MNRQQQHRAYLGVLFGLMIPLLTGGGCSSDGGSNNSAQDGNPIAVSAVISASEGGSLTSSDGSLTLTFPPGALSQDTEISITPATVDGGVGYELGPDGLQLNIPATVTYNTTASEALPEEVMGTPLFPVFVESDGAIESPQNIRIERDQDVIRVTADLIHFSKVVFTYGELLLDVFPGSFDTVAFSSSGYNKNVGESFSDQPRVEIVGGQGPSINLGKTTVSTEPFVTLNSPAEIDNNVQIVISVGTNALSLIASSFTCNAVGVSQYAIKYVIEYGTSVTFNHHEFGEISLSNTGELVIWVGVNCLTTTPTLSVTKSGSGTGTVDSNHGGIQCGATCSASYAQGATVILIADADPGSVFDGWSGGGCAGAGACTVVLTADTTVTATFNTSGASQTACLNITTDVLSGGITSAPFDLTNDTFGAFGPVTPFPKIGRLAEAGGRIYAASPGVSGNPPPTLSVFSQDPGTCTLELLDSTILPNSFGATIAAFGDTVYVGSNLSGAGTGIRGFTFDPGAGSFSEITGSPFATGGFGVFDLTIYPTGTYLLAAVGENVQGFAINPNTKALTNTFDAPSSVFGSSPFVVSFNPAGTRVYAMTMSPSQFGTVPFNAVTGAIDTTHLRTKGLISYGLDMKVGQLNDGTDVVLATQNSSVDPASYRLQVETFNHSTETFSPTTGSPHTINGINSISNIEGLNSFVYVIPGNVESRGIDLETGAVGPPLDTATPPITPFDVIIRFQ